MDIEPWVKPAPVALHFTVAAMPRAVWLIMEQVAIAALDTRALDLAAELIKDIKAKFPESERSTRLAVRAYTPPRHVTMAMSNLAGYCRCCIESIATLHAAQ